MSAKNAKTLQDQLNELNEIIEWFDSADFDLEKALEQYKKAESVAEDIRARLAELKNEINVLDKSFDKEG